MKKLLLLLCCLPFLGLAQTNTFPASGNVGIGTTNPLYPLEISTGGATHALFKGSFAGIQGIQVERNGGDNIRLVTNYTGYGGGLESSSALRFAVDGNNINSPSLYINTAGNIGIGTTAPDAKLTVKGKVHAEEVKVDLSVPGPDYVFKDDYDLRSLEAVQQYIKEHGHLPNIPSAMKMEENGVELGLMNMKLLEKIEELTLYAIAQQQQLDQYEALETQFKALQSQHQNLQEQINELKTLIK